jgi:membrane protein required for colicin V production
MDFNIFDVIVISITLILAIKGYFSGIIKEIAGLIGIGAGIFLGSIYYKNVGAYINDSILKIPNESAINVVGFVAVFVITWLIIVLIGMLLAKILQVAKLGVLDRIGGVIFSAGKFFLIVSVIVMGLSQIEALKSTLEKYQKNSMMWPIMEKVGETIIHIKPEEIQKQIDDVKAKVNEKVGDSLKETIEQTKEKIANSVAKEVNTSIQKQLKGE